MKEFNETPENERPEQVDIYGQIVPAERIESAMNYYRRYRDYNVLFFSGIYILNIVDALVDAYMFEYDISDDLSLEVKPDYIPYEFSTGAVGMRLCLKFLTFTKCLE
ncbi:MAG: hypothetical protein HC906_03970 [Bacteroidales bacterium]|nr:hypothetical protein [Bacteroidales bacterium]